MSSSGDSPFFDAAEGKTDQDREAVRRWVEQLRAFYVHAAVFAGVMVIIFVVNLVVNLGAGVAGEFGAWWSIWALLGWGIGITLHGLVVRLARPRSSGSSWTERKVDEILSETKDDPRP